MLRMQFQYGKKRCLGTSRQQRGRKKAGGKEPPQGRIHGHQRRTVTPSETANKTELEKIDALIGVLDAAVGDVVKTQPGFVAAAIAQQPANSYQVAKLEGTTEAPVRMDAGSGQ